MFFCLKFNEEGLRMKALCPWRTYASWETPTEFHKIFAIISLSHEKLVLQILTQKLDTHFHISLEQKGTEKSDPYIMLGRCAAHLEEAKRDLFSLVEVKKNLENPDLNLNYNLSYSSYSINQVYMCCWVNYIESL